MRQQAPAFLIVIYQLAPNTKPIPRWDVHFGVLKMTERTPQPLVSPLGPNWVGTDSVV